MATQYTLTVKNNSTLSGDVVVYQRDPLQKKYESLYSLAWFSKPCYPNTTLTFRWRTGYSFVWSETSELRPGIVFNAYEVKVADPSNPALNTTGFSRQDDTCLFTPPQHASNPGSLNIQTDGAIPARNISIGIGMSGRPTFALQAAPFFTLSFMPHPEYWVAFGDFEEGVVMDLNRIRQTAKVIYPVNVFSQTMTFNPDNTWSPD